MTHMTHVEVASGPNTPVTLALGPERCAAGDKETRRKARPVLGPPGDHDRDGASGPNARVMDPTVLVGTRA